jgi:predicted NAD/FAD-binding protein
MCYRADPPTANFIAFLRELGIDTIETGMSFSVSRDNGAFEWAGSSIQSLFAQRENMFRLSFWRMIFDIVRFNTFALDLLDDPNADFNGISIGKYLDQQGYSKAFRDDYLIPMTASVWSTGPEKCALDFPAITLVRFMWNHHLLTLGGRPNWMTIPGGSKRYIDAVMQSLPPAREHRNMQITKIKSITGNGKTSYMLFTAASNSEYGPFDDVIFACHADQTLEILGREATAEERNCLRNFKTTANIAYLHSDSSVSFFSYNSS